MAIWFGRNVANINGTWGAANATAQAGPTADAAGSLGSFSGNSGGIIEQPVVRYYGATIFNSDGSTAVNGVRAFLINAMTGALDAGFPTGAVAVNHPAGHPTQITTDTGWILFSKTALLADHVNMVFMVPDQGLTVGFETGVSVPLAPQLTNNGNG